MYGRHHDFIEILRPRPEMELPLIVVMPAAGDEIPGSLDRTFALQRDEIQEIAKELAETDAEKQFASAVWLGATVVINRLSSLVVDMSRRVPLPPPVDIASGLDAALGHDLDPPPPLKGAFTHAVPGLTPDGRQLHDEHVTHDDAQQIMDSYYYPFHGVIEDLARRFITRFGRCWIIEARAHDGAPVMIGKREHPRPFISLSYDERHVSSEILKWFENRKPEFEHQWSQGRRRETPGRRPMLEISHRPDGSIMPLEWRAAEERLRSMRISVVRGIGAGEAEHGPEDPGEAAYLIRGLLRHVSGRVAEQVDVHRTCIPASDAAVIVDQHIRASVRSGIWSVIRVLDGDEQAHWRVHGWFWLTKTTSYLGHLRGCWVVHVASDSHGPGRSREISSTYLVDKWSGETWATALTFSSYGNGSTRCPFLEA